MDEVLEIAKRAKKSAPLIGAAKSALKNRILEDIAKNLVENADDIIAANKQDIKRCQSEGISESLLDRLMLDKNRIEKISKSINEVIELTDPAGQVIFGYNLPNGLILKNIRVPFGVIGIIYEARPNVTVDAAVLCIKAGSCVILRGSSHALATNLAIVEIMRKALLHNGMPEDVIQIIPTGKREDAERFMQLRAAVRIRLPRGLCPL